MLALVNDTRTELEKIVEEANKLINDKEAYESMSKAINPYGDGKASERITDAILKYFNLSDKEVDEFDKIFATNPVVYVFNLNNQLQYAKPLLDFDNISYVKRKIKSGKSIYRLAKDSLIFNKRKNKMQV